MSFNECPACSYLRQSVDVNCHPDICPACGVVYQKWLDKHQEAPPQQDEPEATYFIEEPESFWQRLVDHFFYIPERVDSTVFWGRALLLIVFALWGGYFIVSGIDWQKIGGSFMHNINLPFHEFGHVLFMPLGRFMTILGGSLFQVLMPLGIMLAFVIKRHDPFAGSIMLWWSGQSFIDISPYIADAPYRAIPLIGGMGEEAHDWGNLLTMTNAMSSAKSIANMSFVLGALLIVLAVVWGARILYLQKKQLVDFAH